jgi:hypothetical protein
MSFKIVLAGPVTTRSGYGARSRDICTALIQLGYDVDIYPIPWGTTPNTGLNAADSNHRRIHDRLKYTAIESKPDIFIHCALPNEFQPVGKYNIGLTAGIETDGCAVEWIEGCNRMDLVLTSSTHSKTVLEKTEYQKRDSTTNQVIELIKCKTPVQVLMEGVDLQVYNPTNQLDVGIVDLLDSIPEQSLFLNVSMWIQGELGEDRKDLGMLIHTFIKEFSDLPEGVRPALLLKTSTAGFSIIERHDIERKIQFVQQQFIDNGYNNLPNIYVVYGDLSDYEMNSLYNHSKVKAMVSFTKGEGYGRPLLEFTTTGKPVLVSDWSGQTDFMNPDHSFLLPGGLNKVGKSAVNKWIIPESKWFTVNYHLAASTMKSCFIDYNSAAEKCKPHAEITRTKFSLTEMQNQLQNILTSIQPVETPTLKTIKLPKRTNK